MTKLEGTLLMLSKYLAIFSSVAGKVFLGMVVKALKAERGYSIKRRVSAVSY